MNKLDLTDIEACIFDLDGTILDSMNIWQEVDRKYLSRFGIAFDPKYSDEIKKLTFNESAKYFKEKFQLKKSEEEIIADWNLMVEAEYRDNILMKHGVRELLEELHKRNMKMCIATSCNKEHAYMALERLGILDYFAFVKTCNDVGKNKSFPDIYLACSTHLGVKPEQTIVFEDLLAALRVAKHASFQTCGIYDPMSSHETSEIREVCHYFIKDFRELNLI